MIARFLSGSLALFALMLPSVPALAAPAPLSSPWGGSLSAADQAASAATRPTLADANWNHEVCVIAYAYEEAGRKLAAAHADAERRRGEYSDERWAAIEREIAQKNAHIAKFTRNIPKCRGQFFRPAIENACAATAGANRFCDQLKGAALPGVEMLDDRLAFAHGLAWNKIGDLFSKGVTFTPSPWRAAQVGSAYRKPAYAMTVKADGSYYFETENGPRMALFTDSLLYHLRRARDSHVDAAATGGVPYIAATNKAVRADGSAPPTGLGQWAFSIDMMRRPVAEASEGERRFAAEMTRQTGLVTDLGTHLQLPRLHLQAQVYDILVQSDFARLAVEMGDGSQAALSEPAHFVAAPDDGSPRFGTSYASYQVHATMMPSAEDMETLLRPDATFLVARFEMLVEDGSIDIITLRTPLTGMGSAWQAMNAEHGRTRARIEQTRREWDDRIAGKEREFAARAERLAKERADALAKAEGEARAYLRDHPFAAPCAAMPGGDQLASLPAATLRSLIAAAAECDRLWVDRARSARTELARLQRSYRSLGGGDRFIGDEIARWDAALDTRNKAVARFNADLAARNQRVEADNRRIAAANADRSASRSSAVDRRRQGQSRRLQSAASGRERSAADDFYDAQSRPYRPYFRDVTVPPKPTGYMGTGYW